MLKVAKRRGEFPGDIQAVMPEGFDADYRPRERFLAQEEARQLLAELAPDRAARVAFIIATGARWSATDRARRSDVDLEARMVRIRGSKTKNAARVLPLVAWGVPLMEHVLRYAEGEGDMLFREWSNSRRDLAQTCERAGIERVSANDLRRTYGSWLRHQGVEPHLIGAAMGQADSRMVERVYGRMTPEALGNALEERVGDCSKYVANPRRSGGQMRRQRRPRSTFPPAFSVSRARIELATRGFSVHCSTD